MLLQKISSETIIIRALFPHAYPSPRLSWFCRGIIKIDRFGFKSKKIYSHKFKKNVICFNLCWKWVKESVIVFPILVTLLEYLFFYDVDLSFNGTGGPYSIIHCCFPDKEDQENDQGEEGYEERG